MLVASKKNGMEEGAVQIGPMLIEDIVVYNDGSWLCSWGLSWIFISTAPDPLMPALRLPYDLMKVGMALETIFLSLSNRPSLYRFKLWLFGVLRVLLLARLP